VRGELLDEPIDVGIFEAKQRSGGRCHQCHSTVTLFAKFLGLSTSVSRAQAV
jgi:hypothetical protein